MVEKSKPALGGWYERPGRMGGARGTGSRAILPRGGQELWMAPQGAEREAEDPNSSLSAAIYPKRQRTAEVQDPPRGSNALEGAPAFGLRQSSAAFPGA